MGQAGVTAFSIVGTVVGSYFGGPIGGAIGSMAGGLIGSFVFGRHKKPLISDIQVGNASYGNPIPILYGTARLPGTMIWCDQVKKTSSSVGKGLSGQSTYKYHQSAAFGLCEGPATILKIFLDGKLFWDGTSATPTELTKKTFWIRSYPGDEAQLPDWLITGWVNDNVATVPNANPAYRGLCYMIFQGVDLNNYGGRMPQVVCVVASNVTQTTIFKPLAWLANDPDPGSQNSIALDTNHASGVDWSRNWVYVLSSDGTIRVFDLVTTQCIQEKTKAQLATFWPIYGDVTYFTALACCNGSQLYVVANIYTFPSTNNGSYLWTIDPSTLTITNQIKLSSLDGAFAGYSGVSSLTCFQLVSLQGSVDMVAGIDYLQGPFVVNPLSGALGLIPFDTSAYNWGSNIVVGKSDDTNGTVELWLVDDFSFNPGTDAAPPGLRIAKIPVAGSDPSGVGVFYQLMATLHPTDFALVRTTGGIIQSGVVAIYDAADDSLILTNYECTGYSGYPTTAKWSAALGIIWTNPAWKGPQQQMPNTMLDGNYSSGAITFTTGTTPALGVPVIDTTTGALAYSPIATADNTRQAATFGGQSYNSQSNSMVYRDQTGQWYVAYLQRGNAAEVSVAAIITDLCARVGVDSSMIDVSLVTQTTVGYVIPDLKAAAQAIGDLCQAYQIDMVESDYKLKFIPRGQASVATIPQASLRSLTDGDPSKYWSVKTAEEQEMPLQVNLKYSDPALDYQPGAAYAKRVALPVPTQYSKRKMQVDLPVVATNQEARGIAENWLYTVWASRDTYETALSQAYLYLDPTDNVTVTMDNGDVYVARIQQIETGADLGLKLTLASEDQTVYAPPGTGGAVYTVGQQTLTAGGFADFLPFNVPLLQDADAAPAGQSRVYYAAGAASGWLGGTVYKSTDAINWPAWGVLPSAAISGFAVTALGDTTSPFSTDYTNTVTVSLRAGDTPPSSCAYVDLMNGANAALLGSEIIQFMTVTDNADGSITLSDLVRGRRGTEWATSGHRAGEIFIMLQVGLVVGNTISQGEIGTTEVFKLVPNGVSINTTPFENFAYLGYDLKPYAPVNFARRESGSPPDLIVTWVRRTRIGGMLVDGTDTVPLYEDTEAYEAYVLPNAGAIDSFDPTNAATYTRKYTPTTATLTYTASQMSADSFDPAADTLYLAVYQISGEVGRGFRGYQAVPAF
jgi:WD40 repeat protein